MNKPRNLGVYGKIIMSRTARVTNPMILAFKEPRHLELGHFFTKPYDLHRRTRRIAIRKVRLILTGRDIINPLAPLCILKLVWSAPSPKKKKVTSVRC